MKNPTPRLPTTTRRRHPAAASHSSAASDPRSMPQHYPRLVFPAAAEQTLRESPASLNQPVSRRADDRRVDEGEARMKRFSALLAAAVLAAAMPSAANAQTVTAVEATTSSNWAGYVARASRSRACPGRGGGR